VPRTQARQNDRVQAEDLLELRKAKRAEAFYSSGASQAAIAFALRGGCPAHATLFRTAEFIPPQATIISIKRIEFRVP
jgi:hypothetical protein